MVSKNDKEFKRITTKPKKDYKITSRKPAGYGKTRQGYYSSRTGKYYTWIES